MSYLIFASFEVGGWPLKFARVLRSQGIEVYYVSIHSGPADINSAEYHYGESAEAWDLSGLIKKHLAGETEIITFLKMVETKYGIKHFPSADLRSHTLREVGIIALLKMIKIQYGIKHCFATGLKSHLLREAGMEYVNWVCGSDLDQNCFLPRNITSRSFNERLRSIFDVGYRKNLIRSEKAPMRDRALQTVIPARKTIRNASSVIVLHYQHQALEKIASGKRKAFIPHLLGAIPADRVRKLKEESRATVSSKFVSGRFAFSSARHWWHGDKAKEADNKGNDVALRSFAEFTKSSGKKDVRLVMSDRGPDAANSRALAKKLSVEGRVVWLNEMPRGDLDKLYAAATVCLGQFGTPALTYAAVEPLQFGTPCVSYYWDSEKFDKLDIPFYPSPPPIFNSNDPAAIGRELVRIFDDDDYRSALEGKSYEWARENCSEEKFAASFLALFDK